MAKAKTTTAPKAKKKTGKPVKAVAKSAPKIGKTKKGGKSKSKDAAEALWKLAEHPLVAELLAVGATAAVAAIAEQSIAREGKKRKGVSSSTAVKAAGAAAAAAIGQRLITEFTDVKNVIKAAKPPKTAKA